MAEKVNFNATIGPEEVGVVVGAWMFGMFTLQAFNYFSYFPKDSRRLKITVAVLWVLELIHVILSCIGLYETTVKHFGDADNVLLINKAIGLSLIISAVVGPGVQTIDSLLAWTINTGLLTSAASIMMLIFFITMNNFAWLTMLLVIPRLFANSMLASLNSRNKLHEGNTQLIVDVNAQLSSSGGARMTNPNRKFPTSIAIEMTHTREVTQDLDMDAKHDLEDQGQAM
ncbi:hypothetical protein B0H17DRAFT_1211741 [Mycena rosella]|uniref:DUF6534 domain-containing protein n=1 Tax=Mycena rosella TaxID=1033263 RepID=A0AAD7CU58_MYCRO|nr:hypothetical protein B0H17DRAFT_1211741 [Mycena rosella]